ATSRSRRSVARRGRGSRNRSPGSSGPIRTQQRRSLPRPWTLPSMGVNDPTPVRALDVLNRAADAVAEVVAGNTEWGPSGRRDGQYAVDLAADEACLDVLYGAGLRVLSEESGVTAPPGGGSAPIVVVDPLDGSTNASRGVPWYASALCLVDDDGPAAAVVLNLATSQRFEAVRGEGA